MSDTPENEQDSELNDQEREVVNLLSDLETPVIPTTVAERISHALSVEAATRISTLAADQTDADESASANTNSHNHGASVTELAPRRQQRTKLWGALAGVAAVAAIGVVGVNVINQTSSNDIVASEDPTSATSTTDQSGTLATTPIVATSMTYQKPTVQAQVQHQLDTWKTISQQVHASPELLTDIDLDGKTDSGPDKRHMLKAVQDLRQRLPQCLAGMNKEGGKPLVVELAQFQENTASDEQEVAVVAISKVPIEEQTVADYNGPVEVYLLGVRCERSNPDIRATVTVQSDSN